MQIIFVTSNSRKIAEAKLTCGPAGIKVISESADIDEIQSSVPKKISEHKARSAFSLISKPLVVTDTFWSIPSLNGFPGAYMKDVANWFSEEDFINLIDKKQNKSISFSENITFFDGKIIKQFSKEFKGKIVSPRGDGNSIENVAEFDGVTLGERRERREVSHKADDYVWNEFVDWFITHKQ